MEITPRPWHQSPALWFFLPGLAFILWAWMFSMQRMADLSCEIGGYSLELSNDGATVSTSWQKTSPRPSLSSRPAKAFDFTVRPRWPYASQEWFPLPSSMVVYGNSSTPRHDLAIPHWFLLLVYLGLWQLPWLARYHRRQRIGRALAQAPADAARAAGDCPP